LANCKERLAMAEAFVPDPKMSIEER